MLRKGGGQSWGLHTRAGKRGEEDPRPYLKKPGSRTRCRNMGKRDGRPENKSKRAAKERERKSSGGRRDVSEKRFIQRNP